MQVLANPTADLQEAPEVSREQLRERGVRPYDEKVLYIAKTSPCCFVLPSPVSARCCCRVQNHEGLDMYGRGTW